jgi:hypothetical protein
MMRMLAAVLLMVSIVGLSGCASSPPPTVSSVRPESLQRVVVIGSGESMFTMLHDSTEAASTFDGVVNEVLKWIPASYSSVVAPLARIVSSIIKSSAAAKRAAAVSSHVGTGSPASVVAQAFARRLEASGQFVEVRAVDREPVGDDRRRADAIIRLMVPAWGLVRVREGKPDLLAGFADVRAQMVVRATGVVAWEHDEDVTHAERLPLQAFTHDGDLARHQLLDVLERAGQRVAHELLYARGAGR